MKESLCFLTICLLAANPAHATLVFDYVDEHRFTLESNFSTETEEAEVQLSNRAFKRTVASDDRMVFQFTDSSPLSVTAGPAGLFDVSDIAAVGNGWITQDSPLFDIINNDPFGSDTARLDIIVQVGGVFFGTKKKSERAIGSFDVDFIFKSAPTSVIAADIHHQFTGAYDAPRFDEGPFSVRWTTKPFKTSINIGLGDLDRFEGLDGLAPFRIDNHKLFAQTTDSAILTNRWDTATVEFRLTQLDAPSPSSLVLVSILSLSGLRLLGLWRPRANCGGCL